MSKPRAPARRCARIRPCSPRLPRCSPTARSSRPSSPRRWRCRRRPTSPAKSAATSIRTRSSPRARICARRSDTGSEPALRDTYRRLSDEGPYSPDAASAGRRTLKNACLDLLAGIGKLGRHRACRPAISDRRQHDRPDGGAGDAVAASGARAPGGARRFLPPLRKRPAGDRQMVRPAGDDPRADDARPRARTDRACRVFARQSQPRALADRIVRAGEPDPVQPRRRSRIPLRRRHRPRARRPQSAGRGPHDDRVPQLARARAAAARHRRSRIAAGRRRQVAVERSQGHRRTVAGGARPSVPEPGPDCACPPSRRPSPALDDRLKCVRAPY